MDKLQNIYDHPDFYEGYRSLRENPVNYNVPVSYTHLDVYKRQASELSTF